MPQRQTALLTSASKVAWSPSLRTVIVGLAILTIVGLASTHTAHADTYYFVRSWGSPGTGPGQFSGPIAVAVNPSGSVYVGDYHNNRVEEFTSSGTFVTMWGSPGSGPGQFNSLSDLDVATDSSGNVYVADAGNNRVEKFSSSGTFVTMWGSSGSGPGQFNNPNGIAVDPSDNVYVADYGNNRIEKFTSSGTFLVAWGSSGTGSGQFNGPSGLATDSSGSNLYTSDSGNNRVEEFTSSGTFVTMWGSSGTASGQFSYPLDVAVDSSNNVYVLDSSNNRIQKFTSSGTFATMWGSPGTGPGQFSISGGGGVALDSLGNVYVADTGNNRIQVFSNALVVTVTCPSSGITTGKPVTCNASITGGTAPCWITWTANGGSPSSASYSFTVCSLPPSFTTTYATKGTDTVSASVSDNTGTSTSVSTTVTVSAQPLTVGVRCNPATAGKPFNCAVSATGGTTPYQGIGNFTVSEPVKGTFTEKFNVTDTNHVTATGSASVTVAPQPLIITASCSSATAGKPMNCGASVAGGTSPYRVFGVSWGDGSTGTLLGCVGCNSGNENHIYYAKGTYHVLINQTDANGLTTTFPIDITVSPQPFVVTIDCGNGHTASKPVTCTASANGGTSPYTFTWCLECPVGYFNVPGSSFTVSLPKGTFTFSLEGKDANNATVTTSTQVTVVPQQLVVSVTCDAAITAGKPFNCNVSAAGGTSPYQGVGVLSITQPIKGAFIERFNVTDANGVKSTGAATVTVSAQPLIANLQCPTSGLTVSKPFSCNLTVTGGTSPYVVSSPAIHGGYHFLLTSSSTSLVYQEVVKGTYLQTVTVVDVNNAKASSSTTTNIGSQSMVVTVVCGVNTLGQPVPVTAGKPFACDVSASGGTGPYTGPGTFTLTEPAKGTYTEKFNVTDANGASATGSSIVVVAPQPFTVGVNCGSATTSKAVVCTASPTGGSSPYTSASWSGSISSSCTVFPACLRFVTSFATKGTYTVTASLIDANGASANGSATVVVTPQPLIVTVTCPTSGATAGKPFSCTVSATGGTAPYTGAGPISLTEPVKGTFNEKFNVTDANQVKATGSASVIVAPQPIIAHATCSTQSATAGKPVNCSVSVTGGTAPYWYCWADIFTNNNTIFVDVCHVPPTFTTTFAEKGTYTIAAVAYDANALTENSRSDVQITVSSQPMVVTVACPTGGVTAGKPFSCKVSATGGTAPYTGTGNFTVTEPAKGTFAEKFNVTDANGVTASGSAGVTVAPQPFVVTVNCSGNNTAGKPVNCSASVTGGTPPYPLFGWDCQQLACPPFVCSCSNYSTVFSVKGTYVIRATAADSNNARATGSASVTIAPQPLAVTVTCPSSGLTAGKPFSCSVSAAGGTPPYNGAGSFAVTQPVKGTFTESFTVTDANNQAASGSTSVTIGGQPFVVNAGCSGGTAGKPVTCSASATGGTPPYSFFWGSSVGGPAGPSATFIFPAKGREVINSVVYDSNNAHAAAYVMLNIASQSLVVTVTCPSSGLTAGKPFTCTVSATGGTGPYAGTGQFALTEPVKGTFTEAFSVSDANQVLASGSANVIVAAQPLSALSCVTSGTAGKPVNCVGDATGGTSPYRFSWSAPGGSPSSGIGPNFATTYPVKGTYQIVETVTDANNVTTIVRNPVMVTAQPLAVTASCQPGTAGKPITCNASASGGTTPYRFVWSTPNGGTIGGQSSTTIPLPSGPGPGTMVLDPQTGMVYVGTGGCCPASPGYIYVINGTTNTVMTTITVNTFSGGGLGIDTVLNRIYMGEVENARIAEIDGSTNNIYTRIAVSGCPGESAADPGLGKLYDPAQCCPQGLCDQVVVVSESTRSVIGYIPINGVASGVAADPTIHRIYAMAGVGSVTDTRVIDSTLDTVVATIPDFSVFAVNTQTNRLYGLTSSQCTSPSSCTLKIVDATTNLVIGNVTLPAAISGVGVNPVTNRIYVSLSSGDLAVIDGVSNTIVSTTSGVGGSNGRGVAVNPNTGAIYVLIPAQSVVRVIYDNTNSITVTFPVKGTYSITARLVDANNATALASVPVTIGPQPLIATTVCSPGGATAGKPFTCIVSATGGTAPYIGTGNFTVTEPVKGTFTERFSVKDSNNVTVVGSTVVVVSPQPLTVILTCPSGLTAGKPFGCTARVTGGTTPYSGYFLIPYAGIGSPSYTEQVKGTFTERYAVTDANGVTATGSTTVTIAPQPIVVTVNCGSGQTAGKPFSCSVSATGGTPPYNGAGSFAVTQPVKGTFTESFNVTDANGASATGSTNVVVQPQRLVITASCSSGATAGKPVNCTSSANGGTRPYKFFWILAGFEPIVAGIGNNFTWVFSVKATTLIHAYVTDANNVTASVDVPVVVAPQPLVVVVNCPTTGLTTAKPFSCTVSTTGGTAPYSGTGSFSLTEPVKGTFIEKFNVTDANHTTSSGSATVTVSPQPLLASFTCPTAGLTAGKPFLCTLSVSGGSSPYQMDIGVSAAFGSGPISGYFTEPVKGTYQLAARALDSNGISVTASTSVTVGPQALIATASCPSAGLTAGKPFTCTVSATGGTAPYTGTGNFTVVEPVKGTATEQFSVRDANNVTTTGSEIVTIYPQPVVLTASCGHATAGKPVTCTSSATGGTTPYAFTWSASTGAPSDGSGSSFTTVFPVKGTDRVAVSVRDANSASTNMNVSVTVSPQPLTPSFTFNPASPTAGKPVSFTASASGGTSPYSFRWSLGDSTSAIGSQAAHSYGVKGIYSVTITSTDANGVSASSTQQVSVAPQALASSFTYSPSMVIAGVPETFTATASGGTTPYMFTWDFGDSGGATGSVVGHTYALAGVYIVALTTRDMNGAIVTTSTRITVAVHVSLSKFFTRSQDPNDLLPVDSKGNPKVDIVMGAGVVRSTNPGQPRVWVNATNIQGSPVNSLTINETLPIDWLVDPPWIPGKGAIHVYFVYANKTLQDITSGASITTSSGNPQTVLASFADIPAATGGQSLLPGQAVYLAVKLSYGLDGTVQHANTYPRFYGDTARLSAWTMTAFSGIQSTNTYSAFFVAYPKVLGNVDGDFKVDIFDIATVALAYGTHPGDAMWNPNCDFLNLGVIDIQDVAIAAYYYGTSS